MYILHFQYFYCFFIVEFKDVIPTQLDGCWISEKSNHRIECNVNDDKTWLICTWPNEYVEMFELDSENLKGITNPEIIGYLSEVDLIIWNTGSRWIKEGNYTQKKSNNIQNLTNNIFRQNLQNIKSKHVSGSAEEMMYRYERAYKAAQKTDNEHNTEKTGKPNHGIVIKKEGESITSLEMNCSSINSVNDKINPEDEGSKAKMNPNHMSLHPLTSSMSINASPTCCGISNIDDLTGERGNLTYIQHMIWKKT